MAHNQRNDRIIGKILNTSDTTKKKVYRTMKLASVMVLAAVSKSMTSPVIFVDQGAKMNAKCYVQNNLKPMLESSKNRFGEKICGYFNQTARHYTHRMSVKTGAMIIFHGFRLITLT